MNKLSALWGLFKQGQVIADAKRWKERQISATVLGAVLIAAVNVIAAFGYEVPIDVETANAIAGGIIGAVNVVLTIVTTDKVGIRPDSDPGVQAQDSPGDRNDRPSGLP